MSAFAVAAFYDPALPPGAERVDATVWIRAAGIPAGGIAASLRLWTPAGCEVAALRETEPQPRDLFAHGVRVDDRTIEVACGEWADGVYEYELAITLPARAAGDEMLAARVGVLAGEEVAGQALIPVTWTDAVPLDDSTEPDDLPTGASAQPPPHRGEPAIDLACPACGARPDDGDRYCEACGRELAAG
jgi:hypothetical protein